MIEYCQVRFHDEDEGEKVIALNENGVFLKGKSFIEIFNKLGKDNWKMCGQVLDTSRFHQRTERENYFNMYFFMREIKE